MPQNTTPTSYPPLPHRDDQDDARRTRTGHPSRSRLYFSFYGGALAWTAHLLLAWLIAEFACIAQVDHVELFGITLIAWSLLLLSLLMFLLAIAAALAGWHAKHRLKSEETLDHEGQDVEIHFARSGAIMSGLFALVIIAQTVPIFYFLGSC